MLEQLDTDVGMDPDMGMRELGRVDGHGHAPRCTECA